MRHDHDLDSTPDVVGVRCKYDGYLGSELLVEERFLPVMLKPRKVTSMAISAVAWSLFVTRRDVLGKVLKLLDNNQRRRRWRSYGELRRLALQSSRQKGQGLRLSTLSGCKLWE